jgi:hypothetical protein
MASYFFAGMGNASLHGSRSAWRRGGCARPCLRSRGLATLPPQPIEFVLLLLDLTAQALHLALHRLELEGQIGGPLTIEHVLDPGHPPIEILGGRQKGDQGEETGDGEGQGTLLHG